MTNDGKLELALDILGTDTASCRKAIMRAIDKIDAQNNKLAYARTSQNKDERAALRKVEDLMRRLRAAISSLPDTIRYPLRSSAFKDGDFDVWIKFLSDRTSRPSGPGRKNADLQRLAVQLALDLLRQFSNQQAPPRKKWLELAAVLYGDATKNLDKFRKELLG